MSLIEKITCKCLRCGQEHTYLIKEVSSRTRCPNCGGEIDFKPSFSEWYERQSAENQKMLAELEQKMRAEMEKKKSC